MPGFRSQLLKRRLAILKARVTQVVEGEVDAANTERVSTEKVMQMVLEDNNEA